jgi:hypothetical protein
MAIMLSVLRRKRERLAAAEVFRTRGSTRLAQLRSTQVWTTAEVSVTFLPSMWVAVARFGVGESLDAVRAFFHSILADPTVSLTLFTAPPRKVRAGPTTLHQASFVPRARLFADLHPALPLAGDAAIFAPHAWERARAAPAPAPPLPAPVSLTDEEEPEEY